jgi:signal transduction histidine kinase
MKFFGSILLLLGLCIVVAAQVRSVTSERNEALVHWKYRAGDSLEWAKQDFNDSAWDTINIGLPMNASYHQLPKIFWIRKELIMLDGQEKNLYALLVSQFAASEIYVNGSLVKRLGEIRFEDSPRIFNPRDKPIAVLMRPGRNLVAIRIVPDIPSSKWVINRTSTPVFSVRLQALEHAMNDWESEIRSERFLIGLAIIPAIFSLLFLMLFFFFSKEILYLFYGLFNFFLTVIAIVSYFQATGQYDLDLRAQLVAGSVLISRLIGMSILLFMLHALNRMRPIFWWYVILMVLIDFPLTLILPPSYMMISNGFRSIILVLCAWLAFVAFRSEKKENILVGILAVTVMMVNGRFFVEAFLKIEAPPIFSFLPPIITSVTIVIFLSLRYRNVNKDLERQLIQVRELSELNLRKEQEKQQILNSQKEVLENQVQERTALLSQQKKELQDTVAELKATQTQLIQAEKMASLGELTAGIAHEIQNPLNFVNNFSDINAELAGEILDAAAKGDLEEVKALAEDIKSNQGKISEHGKRADSIVKNMLQHSRISSGAKEPTDLNKLADEYLRLAYHGFRAKDKSFNTNIRTNLDPYLPSVPVVPQDIGRVLLNLFNNALYAVNERKKMSGEVYEPEISLSSQSNNGNVILTVTDNGPGIPDHIREKIFQPFFTTKPTGEGTGLGLSLSYDIVKAHGGEIKVESTEGEGSVFIVVLPA